MGAIIYGHIDGEQRWWLTIVSQITFTYRRRSEWSLVRYEDGYRIVLNCGVFGDEGTTQGEG